MQAWPSSGGGGGDDDDGCGDGSSSPSLGLPMEEQYNLTLLLKREMCMSWLATPLATADWCIAWPIDYCCINGC